MPFKTNPRQIAQLNDPGNRVCRDRELVVKNYALIHVLLTSFLIEFALTSGVECGLLVQLCKSLLLPFNPVAQGEDQNSPREPCQHVPE